MEQRIALLRGINLGATRRVAMPALRELLAEAGYQRVRTYVQSGNVVFGSDGEPGKLERECQRLISDHFGFEVGVVIRTRDELAAVVERDPFAELADDPKRYQVSFLDKPLAPERVEQLTALVAPTERFVALERELYAWHPDGVARSRLWNKLAGTGLGVKATARNWKTVTTLLAMADEVP